MNKLCTRLLLTAKLEPGKMGLKKNEVNVQELVGAALGNLRDEASKARVHAVTEDASLTAPVDRALLVMILDQYIDNALKYSTPNTPIEISVRRSRTEALISVHNFGSTIRIEDRERVFERFYRATELKDTVPGTGIGLSAVRKAAEAHHGHVWVISEEKEGTTFFLSLPTSTRRTI
jgi:K+-sensing histidine kinase KdpD